MFFGIASLFLKYVHAMLLCCLSVYLPAYLAWKCRNVAVLWIIHISSASYAASCAVDPGGCLLRDKAART
jgi:hypothetical protein